MSEITFEPIDVFLVESSTFRNPTPDDVQLLIKIDYEVVNSAYRAGATGLQVQTQYELTIVPVASDLQPEQKVEEEPVAVLRSRFAVALEANRMINEDDAAGGLLAPAQDMANEITHPYHRQFLSDMFRQLRLQPFELPVTFDKVEAEMSSSPR